jgi:hypothetical protein
VEGGSVRHSSRVVSLQSPTVFPPLPHIQTDLFFFQQGDLRSAALVPSMRPLHHTPHKPPLLFLITHPKLPYNIKHNVERVSRALLQPLMPQTLREDPPAALPRAEPGERAPPGICEETRVDGAPRTRAVYCAAAPRTPAETGAAASWRWQ